MQPLMEMLKNYQNPESLSAIYKQTGLSKKETEKALAAILPAFSTGLKRQAVDQRSTGNFISALSTGRHEVYADTPEDAFGSQNIAEGNGILGHLFGSKDVSRAIASNASAASGVSEQAIKQLLPGLANMVMGGLFKQAKAQTPSQKQVQEPVNALGGGIGGAILGQIVEQMMKGGGKKRSRSSGADNPLTDILDQMMGGGSSSSGAPDYPPAGNPMGDAFRDMLEGKNENYQSPKPKRRKSRDNDVSRDEYNYEPEDQFEDIGSAKPPIQSGRRKKRDNGGLEDLFGDMLESGAGESVDYRSGIESIFDQFMGSKKR